MPDETEKPRRKWPARIGMALVLAVYIGYSSFGVAAPFLWGHHGYHGATYMQRAKMSLRFHIVTPATWSGYDVPHWNTYYFHHPIGYHHLLDLPILILGDHEWVARGLAAVGGLFALWALFALCRRHWSREAGVLACAVYVGLPILCSFSILSDPMLVEMACCIVIVDSFLRYLKEPSWRPLWISCAASVFGGLMMWEVYFQAVFHGLHILGWALAMRKRRERPFREAFRWIGMNAAATGVAMGFHFLFLRFAAPEMWEDFFHSFKERHGASFQFVIDRHKQWLEILYGWPLVKIGLAWLALFLVRLIFRRARLRDQAVLIFFQINVLYIYLFAEGSSIHLYRVFFFSAFFALAVMDFVVDIRAFVGWAFKRWPRVSRWGSIGAATAAILAYFAIETPHAQKNLIESREVMGTHGLPGYHTDYTKQLFAIEVAKRTKPEDFVLVHDNMYRRIEFDYYLDRSHANIYSLSQVAPLAAKHLGHTLVIMEAYPSGAELKMQLELLKKHPGLRFEHYLMIDMRSDKPGLREFEWAAQKPSFWYRWLVSHKYPPMAAKPTNLSFSQCVYAIAQAVPPKDLAPPVSPGPGKEEFGLCWHNYHVLAGNQVVAKAWLDGLRMRMQKRDVPLGKLGGVVAVRTLARTELDVWTIRHQPIPDGLVARWRLTPVLAGKPPLTGEVALGAGTSWPQPDHPGYLYMDAVKWAATPGKYLLTWEIGKPTPPPPKPAPPRPMVVLPPPPPLLQPILGPPPPIATANLGEVEIL